MREAPAWFQAELTRIGGVNPYGEPVLKLVWSTTERRIVGGRFQDGYVGYRKMPGVPGAPCWALMVWEPRELQGTPTRWEWDYRDPETGLSDAGGYPKYGAYRLLQRFIHTEIVSQPMERHWLDKNGNPHVEVLQREKLRVYRMEPGGVLLDLMLPMLLAWRRLTDQAKVKALQQEEQLQKDELLRMAKDARAACRINRGSRLVQKRAEVIERGMKQAMAIAARTSLGMQMTA